MSPDAVVGAAGARLRFASGKQVVDYGMDGGRILLGRAVAGIEAARAVRGEAVRDPFDGEAHLLACTLEAVQAVVDEMRRVRGGDLVVSDEGELFGRVDPAPGWDVRLVGPAAAAGMDFAAVLSRDPALLDGITRPAPPEPAAVAVAEVVVRLAGPLVVHQLSGRSERLAFGIAEVAVGAGLDVEPHQPGGWFELRFAAAEVAAGVPERFRVEMLKRGFLVPEAGPWWPSLAHDYYMIEQTVDCAAAAMAAAAAI